MAHQEADQPEDELVVRQHKEDIPAQGEEQAAQDEPSVYVIDWRLDLQREEYDERRGQRFEYIDARSCAGVLGLNM